MVETFYNDSSILTFGKYRFTKIKEVPIDYLLNIANNPKGCADKRLVEYVIANLEFLKDIKNQKAKFPEDLVVEDSCKKQYYPTQKAAKTALKLIRDTEQIHKKPIRTYECDKCTGWHLTSLSMESWKKKEKR